jgi:hypothetical protein
LNRNIGHEELFKENLISGLGSDRSFDFTDHRRQPKSWFAQPPSSDPLFLEAAIDRASDIFQVQLQCWEVDLVRTKA